MENEAMNPAALMAALHGDLANAMIASTPGGIERQEADGQRTLVENAMVPKDIMGATREQLTGLGFKFGDDVDELFVACELPSGWTKRGTDHSMHSDLFDEQGRKRAGIFYKAAFYDRRAFMSILQRFSVNAYLDGAQAGCLRVAALDGESVVFDAGDYQRGDYDHRDRLRAACETWLSATHPGWQSPLAYW
jgi:hypothetical protein